ncbi:MAG: DNA gyrase subunit A [Candidatus Vogelbacteria bacterium]|nr:DNA gyrase subunit A [Candidatus Vogelbacteria bacterium]
MKDSYKKSAAAANKIIPVDITTEMKDSYLDYAMSVIVARALPDVRDGLKPVHRRILYAMHDLGLTAQAKFRKSALVVGEVLGKYHPHGDTACYDALVRLAQDFSMRYPLVLGQGNFGSIDGDSPAAMRYTEVKMSSLAALLLRDIGKETVDFVPNYSNERQEPTLLPSAIPNLLFMGSIGIAVGMATKIPPHNLGEVMEALIYLVDHEDAPTEELLKFVKGPDFPTGGLVFNEHDIHHAAASGRGGVVLRGAAEIVETKVGASQIIVSSVPYQVNKAELIMHIADLVREKKLEGIKDIRDESTTLADTRVVIDLKSNSQPEKILNALYKHTELETVFHYNMLALVDGVPKLLSLKAILEEFLKHRQTVIRRRSVYDLRRAEEREHVLAGLAKALDQIDQVIAAIKKSPDAAAAKLKLMERFSFSDIQATAILEMKLQKLAGLERQQIEDELKQVQALVKELKALLADPKKILAVIKNEFAEIKKQYADERRTKIVRHGVREIKTEDLVPDKENVLVLTRGGYVKRADPAEYRAQRRGGVGVADLNIKEEDFVSLFLTASTHDDLLFFSDRGKVYQMKMYDIPEGKRATRGKSLMNFLALSDQERISSVLALPRKNGKEDQINSLVMVTKLGQAKRVAVESFREVRRSGIIAITLDPGDELLSVAAATKDDQVILATASGQAIRFKLSDIRQMGRQASGVRTIKLKKPARPDDSGRSGGGDAVIGLGLVTRANRAGEILVVSANGFGKRTKLAEYKVQRRGGSGIKTAKVTAKTGQLIKAVVLDPDASEILTISKHGQVIRTKLTEISTLGRATQGVRIMKVRPGDTLASLTCL